MSWLRRLFRRKKNTTPSPERSISDKGESLNISTTEGLNDANCISQVAFNESSEDTVTNSRDILEEEVVSAESKFVCRRQREIGGDWRSKRNKLS